MGGAGHAVGIARAKPTAWARAGGPSRVTDRGLRSASLRITEDAASLSRRGSRGVARLGRGGAQRLGRARGRLFSQRLAAERIEGRETGRRLAGLVRRADAAELLRPAGAVQRLELGNAVRDRRRAGADQSAHLDHALLAHVLERQVASTAAAIAGRKPSTTQAKHSQCVSHARSSVSPNRRRCRGGHESREGAGASAPTTSREATRAEHGGPARNIPPSRASNRVDVEPRKGTT